MGDIIYEDVIDTANKIRKYLKEAYPSLKFSVKIERFPGGDAVNVALKNPSKNFEEKYAFDQKVRKELHERFKSHEPDGMNDCMVSGYYVYEGKKYNGAMFIKVQS